MTDINHRNSIAKIGARVRFVTGLGHPENERIQHTGRITLPLFPDEGWMAVSDQTGEGWALKNSELDWEVV